MSKTKHIVFATIFSICSLLHAEVATYTVTSYHDIALTDGDAPNGSIVTFNSTTASGTRITAGNNATLTIAGYDGYYIHTISLKMHSNNTSGAGSLSMYLNGTEKATIPDASFADESWNGAYAGSDVWVDVNVPFSHGFTVHEGEVITIVVRSTTNSLYLGGCSISYREGAILSLPKIVSFSTGTEQTISPIKESAAGKGVVLPSLPDADMVWHFLGWTEAPLPHTVSCPEYYKPGTRFFPAKNITLYALYVNEIEAEPIMQDTLFESGQYALVSADPYYCMMKGNVVEKSVQSQRVDLIYGPDSLYSLIARTIPPESRYSIHFTDSTAVIQHVVSGDYIGYKVSSSTHYLAPSSSEWRIMRGSDHSLCFYHHMQYDNIVSAYCLYPNLISGGYVYKDTQLYLNTSSRFILLFPVPENEPSLPLYTTNPLSGMGLESQKEETLYRVYRLDGTCVISCATDNFLRSLPCGTYIITSPYGAEKRIVH